jgi:hypothetical protein
LDNIYDNIGKQSPEFNNCGADIFLLENINKFFTPATCEISTNIFNNRDIKKINKRSTLYCEKLNTIDFDFIPEFDFEYLSII